MPKLPASVAARIAIARAAAPRSPRLAARAVLPLFTSTRPRRPVAPRERAIHDSARRSSFTAAGHELVSYEWGSGAQTVLLVHGWRGRASQFAPLVRELRSEGFRVIAFDAPAHGDSPGRRADIRDWIAAIEALQQRHGRFSAIVGHSLGGLAAMTAVAEGTSAGGVVAIASVGDAAVTTNVFAGALRLGDRAAAELATAFIHRVAPGLDPVEVWRRFDRVAHPIPAPVPLLLVHDAADREVPVSESERLRAAHDERARAVVVTGSGHSRVLGHDATLDAVTAFALRGLAGVDALAPVSAGSARPTA